MNLVTWPSGLRRQLKALVRKGVGSNPTAVKLFCRGPILLSPNLEIVNVVLAPVAQWIRRCPPEAKIVGSIPTGSNSGHSNQLRLLVGVVCWGVETL